MRAQFGCRSTFVVAMLLVLFQSTSTPAQEHRVVRLSPAKSFSPNEVSIAINPVDQNNIVVVAMRRGFRDGVSNHAFFTTDGGNTWDVSDAPNKEKRTQGDDVVGFLSDGTAIRSFISFQGLWGRKSNNFANGIFFSRSSDGGASWNDVTRVVDHLNSITPFEDKPWFTVDRCQSSPHHDNVYVTWTRFDKYGSKHPDDNSHIYFSRSDNGTKSFSSPLRISDVGGDCLDDDGTLEGAVPATGPKGELYVVWAGPRGLEFDRSLDAGKTWDDDRVISEMPGGWNSEVKGVSRHNGMPVTAVDHSDGPFRGTIYVNWIDERNKDKDVFLMNSRDRGNTWFPPLRVNNDAKGNGVDQFFTWMSVDPADGSVNIVYYDRAGLDKDKTGVTLSRSEDGGKTFEQFSVDIPPFECKQATFMGDYIGVAANNGLVIAAFPQFEDGGKLILSAAIFKFH